jgi:predicted acetyltransferase
MRLVPPAMDHIASYVDALRRGWSPDNVRGPATTAAHLAHIERDPEGFLATLDWREPAGATIELPDGGRVPRLPGVVRWMWDGAFAGAINLRWQPGTSELPPHVLGHVGYAVVPWRRGLGYATAALGWAVAEARAVGLDWVEITTDPGNAASRRVIERNGGVLVETGFRPESHGGTPTLRYRIPLR